MTKLFQVKIRAYGHMANFNIEAEDSAESIEQAILDKIGKKGILLRDSMRSFSKDKCWITYEEVVDDKSRSSSLHKEESPRT
jgi:chemotaxis regulatin CheY-phosphate phosphatase CheZ